MGQVLIAFDTNHIKQYVFGTDTLKEIRGGSSRLDQLNRDMMNNVADRPEFQATRIFANGGAGLFLIAEERADSFGKLVQGAYRKETGGGSSITYAIQPVSPNAPDALEDLLDYEMLDTLALVRYKLREQKDDTSSIIGYPSHPFMYLCDSCGVEYAKKIRHERGEPDVLLCESCWNKRGEDAKVRGGIEESIKYHAVEKRTGNSSAYATSPLWDEVIDKLARLNYYMPGDTERPQDFNMFSAFKGTRDYMAVIYADGNNMGQKIEQLSTLRKLHDFAENVDEGVKWAVSEAIAEHLQVGRHMKPGAVLPKEQGEHVFPFDILLLGGDDVVMVVPVSVALNVALTIADKFQEYTGYTLSVGVVLAPIKYPFGLLLDLAETTLKFAKDKSAEKRLEAKAEGKEYNETGMINFMTVLGSSSRDFKKVNGFLKSTQEEKKRTERSFYATLRPYNTKQLGMLLNMIRKGHRKGLGRTKLQQLREAILEMNLTASQSNARALWRNWKPDQRDFVIDCLYEFANLYEQEQFRPDDPTSLSYERPFPWFADGLDRLQRKIYRTSLLDFVELYDFVTGEEADSGDEN